VFIDYLIKPLVYTNNGADTLQSSNTINCGLLVYDSAWFGRLVPTYWRVYCLHLGNRSSMSFYVLNTVITRKLQITLWNASYEKIIHTITELLNYSILLHLLLYSFFQIIMSLNPA